MCINYFMSADLVTCKQHTHVHFCQTAYNSASLIGLPLSLCTKVLATKSSLETFLHVHRHNCDVGGGGLDDHYVRSA